MEQRRVVVRGRVQGVGFRIYVLGVGRGLGLAGTVRNLPDGRSVEAVAQGPREALDCFESALREGPPNSYVAELTSTPEIAELIQIPIGTAASRLRRARQAFRAAAQRLERGSIPAPASSTAPAESKVTSAGS